MNQNLELLWIVQLRWVAIACQALLVLAVKVATGLDVPVLALLGLLAVGAASNGALLLARERLGSARPLVAATLAFDIALLTVGLYLSGGPMNPFSFLYVVPVALGAVVLSPTATAALSLMAIGGYGLLYATTPTEATHHHGSMQLHLEGMWVAMAASAVLVAYFVVSLQNKMRRQEAELLAAREREARYDKLTSLTTLAAGAAHELATPLSTIAVTSKELEHALESMPELAGEARIIREETARCRGILTRLSSRSGHQPGEAAQRVDLLAIIDDVKRRVSEPDRVTVSGESSIVQVPVEPMVEAITALVQNALDASTTTVAIEVVGKGKETCIQVIDHGKGIPPSQLEHVFDPFYSTKDMSNRMGLGLFLARKIAEQLGGSLALESQPGATTATFCLTRADNTN